MQTTDVPAAHLFRIEPPARITFMFGNSDEALTEHNEFGSGKFLMQKLFMPHDPLI